MEPPERACPLPTTGQSRGKRPESRRVPIVEQGDVGRQTLDQSDLLHRKRRARGGNDILNPCLRQADNVRIALDDVTAVLARDALFGLVEAIDDAALVVDFRLRAVEVFGRFGVGLEHPSTKTHDTPAQTVNGEHGAAPKAVDVATVFPGNAEAGTYQVLGLVTCSHCGIVKTFAALQVEAQFKAVNGVFGKSALAEVGQAYRAAHGILPHPARKLLRCKGIDRQQTFPNVARLVRFFRRSLFFELDVVFLREPAQRIRIGHLLVLHQKRDGRTPFPRGEIFKNLLGRDDVEGRRLFLGKGAESSEARTALFKLDEIPYNFLNSNGI